MLKKGIIKKLFFKDTFFPVDRLVHVQVALVLQILAIQTSQASSILLVPRFAPTVKQTFGLLAGRRILFIVQLRHLVLVLKYRRLLALIHPLAHGRHIFVILLSPKFFPAHKHNPLPLSGLPRDHITFLILLRCLSGQLHIPTGCRILFRDLTLIAFGLLAGAIYILDGLLQAFVVAMHVIDVVHQLRVLAAHLAQIGERVHALPLLGIHQAVHLSILLDLFLGISHLSLLCVLGHLQRSRLRAQLRFQIFLTLFLAGSGLRGHVLLGGLDPIVNRSDRLILDRVILGPHLLLLAHAIQPSTQVTIILVETFLAGGSLTRLAPFSLQILFLLAF